MATYSISAIGIFVPVGLFGEQITAKGIGNGISLLIFIGIILLVLFYGPLLYNRNNTRAAITALTLTMIHFIVRAHIMWESCILPMYYMAQWYQYIPTNIKKREVEEDGCG